MEFTSENLLLESQVNQHQISFHPNSYKYKTTNFQDSHLREHRRQSMSELFDDEEEEGL
jgi:hypothetical protein